MPEAMSSADTIYALSSAAGKAGVAVVRLSGAKAKALAEKILRQDCPAPRTARHGALYGSDGTVIDRALVLFFEGPHSFTGEDVVEFHIHGSRAILEKLTATLGECGGARMAQAGEFTRRAFLNGKLDLAEAEGLADLINAETEAQRKQALRQMGGELSALYESWRSALVRALAYAEADIDFPDEDLPEPVLQSRAGALEKLAQAMAAHLDDKRRGERLREGFSIAILGAPNAGKSSLLNALAQRDAAIVSAQAGTTRDVVEVHLDLGGYPVILADTAGLRESQDAIESEGIRRALARAESADLSLIVFDATLEPDAASKKLAEENSLIVLNKIDKLQGAGDDKIMAYLRLAPPSALFRLSAQSGEGLSALLDAIAGRLKTFMDAGEGAPPLTRARHREALHHAQKLIKSAVDGLKDKKAPELVAEDLRMAARALGRITGRVDVEDLLDVIFRDFCIGK
jgi:tRNA modification GTPase